MDNNCRKHSRKHSRKQHEDPTTCTSLVLRIWVLPYLYTHFRCMLGVGVSTHDHCSLLFRGAKRCYISAGPVTTSQVRFTDSMVCSCYPRDIVRARQARKAVNQPLVKLLNSVLPDLAFTFPLLPCRAQTTHDQRRPNDIFHREWSSILCS